MTKRTEETGHIISHTHWDREWRAPIWNSRQRLINMMEALLDAFDKTQLKHFLFDGQVVAIEDYLEFRPEQRELILGHIKNNRIQIGPWYSLPDLYPVCGEALIRNLLTGRRKAESLGKCLNIAYTTFGWGQTAQLPQIYKGFGIDFVVVGKNVSKDRAPNSEFMWQSPDGTKILSTRLGVEKRANFFFFVMMPFLYGVNYWDDSCQIKWNEHGWMWHSSDSNVNSEWNCIAQHNKHPDILKQCLADVWQSTDDTLVKEHRFLGNGCDSTAPNPLTDDIIENANRIDEGKFLKHSSLEQYAEEVSESFKQNNIELKVVKGELRDGPAHALSGNALATRMPLKILNRTAQLNLIRYAESFATLAMMYDVRYPCSFLNKTWHYLLLAHSHDSINGAVWDKAAEDTAYRLRQVIELSQTVMDMSAIDILGKIDFSSLTTQQEILLAAFNPTPESTEQITAVTIDVPADAKSERLTIVDSEGNEIQSQPIDRQSISAAVNVQNSRALPFYCDRYTMYIHTGSIPAYGYKTFRVIPQGNYGPKTVFWKPQYDFGSQITGPNKMANKYLEVTINADGTFDLLHRETGKSYRGLNYFEDSGDIGDYWQRVTPQHNRIYNTKGLQSKIYIKEDGRLVTSFVSELTLEVPARYEDVLAKAPIKIQSQITLKADTPYVQVKVTVTNTAHNHTLRAGFPTYIDTDKSDAQGHFNVDTRAVNTVYNKQGFRDGGMSTVPMQNFIDLSDGDVGLAILNRNLIEYEVSQSPDKTIFLTLLRSVGMKICAEQRCAIQDSNALGPQCLGDHVLEYAVCPHKGNWQQADVYSLMEKYIYSPRVYQISKNIGGSLPQNLSLFSLEPSCLQIAAIKKAQDTDGIVIRFYNPTDTTVEAKLKFPRKPSSAFTTDLNENIKEQLDIASDGTIAVKACKYKILTVLCKL